MSQMRKIIAHRMIESRRTSAHVHCMFEVDLTRIVQLRNKTKSAFEKRNGARLTFMPFFTRAAIIALQQFPIVNASIEGESIRYHRHVNVGIAVALDWGLIVPVLKNADELNFLGLQRGISDLGERARSKKLKPEEVEGSTFTITNPGQFGAVFGLPIINQPNSAIMGVGGITKAPVVVTDDRWQRFHRHPLPRASDSRLRPPHHRRRSRRPVHGRGQENARELERRNRMIYGWAGFAQVEAFKHRTVPSITALSPCLNFSGSTICRDVTASVSCSAADTNDIAAFFFSTPERLANNPSIPVTMEGTNAIPCSSLDRKSMNFSYI